jgi:small-conductance mechanosensitive channel
MQKKPSLKKAASAVILPSTRYIKWLLLLGIVSFFVLGFLGYLKNIEVLLSSKQFSFQIGDFKFSLYLLLNGFLTFVFLLWSAKAITDFLEKRIKKLRGMRPSNRALLINAVRIFIYFLAFWFMLEAFNIDLVALTIFSGAIGIGIGFGLQKITSNFMSGIILLFEKSIEAGDLIELSDGAYGFVRFTSARYTLIETLEGKEVLIPNEDFITNQVVNWTHSNSNGRITIPIGISYNSDIEKARNLMIEAAKEHEDVMDYPDPDCYLKDFGDSSINFSLFFWIDDISEGRYKIQSDVLMSVWKKFKQNNIEIPFPQRDLHIKAHHTNTDEKNPDQAAIIR